MGEMASLRNDYEKQSEALRVCQTQAPKIRQGVEELDKDVKCLRDLREILESSACDYSLTKSAVYLRH